MTTNGPYSSKPYYLRITKETSEGSGTPDPNAGTTYNIGDSGPRASTSARSPTRATSSSCASASSAADDPTILNTIGVVDQQLGVDTPNGRFWHRFNFDGYGEKKDGSIWDVGLPANPTEDWANNQTIGRIWPIFAGERGEYEVAAGKPRRRARPPRLDGRRRRARPPDRRAGLGPVPALGRRRAPARRVDALRVAARVVARPVRAPRVVDRRRAARSSSRRIVERDAVRAA